MTDALPEEQKEALSKQIPMGRLGTADEVAGAVLFLLCFHPMGEAVFWLKSLYQLGFVCVFDFYFWIREHRISVFIEFLVFDCLRLSPISDFLG
jgi:hypothetical protein